MSKPRPRGAERGLTLIELVITLTILALAGTLVAGAFVTGLRAWQSGLRSGREELVARIVIERIATQLRAAIDAPARKDDTAAVAFDAGEDRLRFVTLSASGSAPVQVSYELRSDGGEQSLVYREYPWPDKDFFGAGRPRREERIVEVTGFSVKVVKRIAKTKKSGTPGTIGDTVVAAWSPLDRALPASVSVDIVVTADGQPEPRKYSITVPVPTQR